MATPVLMPKQGQSVESCIITQWFKKKGEQVSKGEPLFSYETDKASFEEPAPADGILLEVLFGEGDEVPVLVNVAAIGAAGEDASSVLGASPAASKVDEPVKTTVEAPKTVEVAKEVEEIVEQEGRIKISPRAKNLAEKLNVAYSVVKGTGPNGRIIERDIEEAAKTQPRLTPLAQEIVKTENVAVVSEGTGIGNRVTAADLTAPKSVVYSGDGEVKPLTNMRKVIAKNMLACMQNSAQLTHHLSADARKILALRNRVKELNKKGELLENITLNDMICFAVIKALLKNPEANCHFLGDSIRSFKKVHLGFAVDTPRGLMVPTVRNADDLSLKGLSNQLTNLAESCRQGKVDLELLSSTAASFTVSNLGGYGIEIFTPIVNLPQAAILGVNTIVHRPANIGDGMMGFVPYLGLSLSYDHRVLDGAPASRLLMDIKKEIENFKADF